VSATGGLATATGTTLSNAAAALLGASNSDFVVWSRKSGAFSVVLSGSPWTELATMRSRRD
jgi:hypothetical protein